MPCQAKWNYIGWLEPIINNHWFGLPINYMAFPKVKTAGWLLWQGKLCSMIFRHFFIGMPTIRKSSPWCPSLQTRARTLHHFPLDGFTQEWTAGEQAYENKHLGSLQSTRRKPERRRRRRRQVMLSHQTTQLITYTYFREKMRKNAVPIPSRGFWEVHMSTTSVRGTQASPHRPLVFLLMIEQSLHFEARFSLTRECLTWWGRNCQKLCPRALMEPHLNNAW